MRKDMLALLFLTIMLVFCGCVPNEVADSEPYQSRAPDTVVTTVETTEASSETTTSTKVAVESSESSTTTTSATSATTTTLAVTTTETTTTETIPISVDFSLADVPPYSDVAYVEINNNIPFFTDTSTTEAFEIYSPLDGLGRCGVAFANICPELMPTEKRGSIGMVKPSGWQTTKYNGLIDGNYLYNRCHLIAYELAAENANTLNLITGTRYLNIQGMLRFENKVADYVNYTGNHVLYRSTPIFEGDNLVASGVLMEGFSVEDAGQGVQFCVFCYNVQPGIGINYADGNSWLIEDTAPETTAEPYIEPAETSPPVQNDVSEQYDYVVNTNTKKFHYPSCSSVEDIKDKNRWDYSGSRDDLIAQGYVPCKRCNP